MSTRSYGRAIWSRLRILAENGIYSFFTLPRDAIYAAGFALLTAFLALVALVSVSIAIVILELLSMILFFSSTLQTLIDWSMILIAVVGLGVVPLAIASYAVTDYFSPPDKLVLADPEAWEYPIVLPLTGFVILEISAEIVLPPWSGIFELSVAGIIVALVLYRGALYPLVLYFTSDSWYSYDDSQRRIHDAIPNGTSVGRITFGAGVCWLAAALTFTVVDILFETLAVTLVDTIAILPFFPPSRTVTIGIPVSIALAITMLYGGRTAAVAMAGERHAIRGWMDEIKVRTQYVLSWLLDGTKTVAATVWVWFGYTVLLRPR